MKDVLISLSTRLSFLWYFQRKVSKIRKEYLATKLETIFPNNLSKFKSVCWTSVTREILGAKVSITGGNNIGRVGTILRVEKHDGSYTIVHVRDENNLEFSTRLNNIFVIGNEKSEVTLLKKHNYKGIIEERSDREARRPKREYEIDEDAEDDE